MLMTRADCEAGAHASGMDGRSGLSRREREGGPLIGYKEGWIGNLKGAKSFKRT